MNGPIETLMKEHRFIEKVLDAMERYADRVGGEDAPREDLARFVGFLKTFADSCHHGKEEDILFRAMVEAGVPEEGGPIAVMLHEHVQGRGLVSDLAAIAGGEGRFSTEEEARVVEAVRAYATLLRAHIAKEDQILYPMAEQVLPMETWQRIESLFDEFEEREIGPGEHERIHAKAERLVTKYAG